MVQAQRSALRVVSRKQLKNAHQLSRFLWLRAYRAMRVCADEDDTQQRVTSNMDEVFEAMAQLARMTGRNTIDIFYALFRAAHGHEYDGSIYLRIEFEG